jgi:hypothetical protein
MAFVGLHISIRRTGACGFDVAVQAENETLQTGAMNELDAIIEKAKDLRAFPWNANSDICVSYRYISGNTKLVQGLLNGWIKLCQQKCETKLGVEKAWR